METKSFIPFYIKISQIIIGIVAFFYVMWVGQEIIVPLIFSIIVAILLNPMVNFLTRIKFNRVVAITIAVLLATLFIAGLLYFICSQATMLADTIPVLKEKFNHMFKDSILWVSDNFNISARKIKSWVEVQKSEGLNNSTQVIGQTLTTVSGVFIVILLMPVYIFLFLFYKPLIMDFIAQLFPDSKYKTVLEVLTESRSLVQSYLLGLLIEGGIIAALNSIGLFALGIDYALLLGVLGALLNLIPYIGGIVAIALPILLAIATKEPIYALYVFILYIIIQLVDNNFIVPKIVASKVKINALASIVVVLIGGALWGVAGMFLSLPLTAICKVIFDRIEPLKPFGFLIGDNMPEISIFTTRFSKKL